MFHMNTLKIFNTHSSKVFLCFEIKLVLDTSVAVLMYGDFCGLRGFVCTKSTRAFAG